MLQVLSGVKAETVSNCSPRSHLWSSTTSRPTCLPICWRSILVKSPLPPNAGSRSSRRTTLLSRLTVRISLFFSPRLPPHPSRESTSIPVVPLCIPAPEVFLSTFLYTKHINHLLATLLPSQRTPQARMCTLSCSNSQPNWQHSPLHTFFSRAPWLSMASGGTPVHSALPTRNSGM